MRFDHEPILTAAGAHWSMPNSPAVAGALHRGSKSGKRARADQQQTDTARVRVIFPLPALTMVSTLPRLVGGAFLFSTARVFAQDVPVWAYPELDCDGKDKGSDLVTRD
jgi:hypothetical protein